MKSWWNRNKSLWERQTRKKSKKQKDLAPIHLSFPMSFSVRVLSLVRRGNPGSRWKLISFTIKTINLGQAVLCSWYLADDGTLMSSLPFECRVITMCCRIVFLNEFLKHNDDDCFCFVSRNVSVVKFHRIGSSPGFEIHPHPPQPPEVSERAKLLLQPSRLTI